jgi:hypothetical protein
MLAFENRGHDLHPRAAEGPIRKDSALIGAPGGQLEPRIEAVTPRGDCEGCETPFRDRGGRSLRDPGVRSMTEVAEQWPIDLRPRLRKPKVFRGHADQDAETQEQSGPRMEP